MLGHEKGELRLQIELGCWSAGRVIRQADVTTGVLEWKRDLGGRVRRGQNEEARPQVTPFRGGAGSQGPSGAGWQERDSAGPLEGRPCWRLDLSATRPGGPSNVQNCAVVQDDALQQPRKHVQPWTGRAPLHGGSAPWTRT